MDIYKNYISEVLFRTKRDAIKYIISLIVIAIILTIVAMACLAVVGFESIFIKSILLGISSVVPVMGSGIVMIPWMIVRMITSEKDLAVLLGVIYVILVVVKQGLDHFIIGKKSDFRAVITFVVFLIFYLIWKGSGVIISSFIIFLVYISMEALTIQNYARSAMIRRRKEEENNNTYR